MNVAITCPNFEHTNVFVPTDRKETLHVKKTSGIKVYEPKITEKNQAAQKAMADKIKTQLMSSSLKMDSSDETEDSGEDSEKIKSATKKIMHQMQGDRKKDVHKTKVTTQEKVDDMIMAQ